MLLLIASLMAGMLLLIGGTALYHFFRYRGSRVVTCPDNNARVIVEVDAADAAYSAGLGNPQIHLRECTRWPEMKNCGQDCVKQIEYSPHDCLVRSVISNWYRGQRCAGCGHTFGEIHWHDHPPALLDDGNRTVEWDEVPVARLLEYLDSHRPVCWDCHIVQTFKREHPELITYRKER